MFIHQTRTFGKMKYTAICMYIESYNCDYDKLWMHLKYDILSWSTFCKLIQLYIYTKYCDSYNKIYSLPAIESIKLPYTY